MNKYTLDPVHIAIEQLRVVQSALLDTGLTKLAADVEDILKMVDLLIKSTTEPDGLDAMAFDREARRLQAVYAALYDDGKLKLADVVDDAQIALDKLAAKISKRFDEELAAETKEG